MARRDEFLEEIGREPLQEIFDGVQDAFAECARFWLRLNMNSRDALTRMRRDTSEVKMLTVCNKYPQIFPSVEVNRRHNHGFVLVETDKYLLTSVISRSRNDVPPPSQYRDLLAMQTHLFGPKAVNPDPTEAILLIVAGRFQMRNVNDRPKEMVVKFRDGTRGYKSDEVNLTKMFSKPRVYQVPAATPKVRQETVIGVSQIIVPNTKLIVIKDDSKRGRGV